MQSRSGSYGDQIDKGIEHFACGECGDAMKVTDSWEPVTFALYQALVSNSEHWMHH
jgi:hypothetical protein